MADAYALAGARSQPAALVFEEEQLAASERPHERGLVAPMPERDVRAGEVDGEGQRG